MTAGAGMIFYFRYEKARMERKRVAEAAKGVGRPKVGGKFELVDHEGRAFGDEDMRGGFSLVGVFGFLFVCFFLGVGGEEFPFQLESNANPPASFQVYFGFTHCPDICPEELDKMSTMIDLVSLPSLSVLPPSPSSTSTNTPTSRPSLLPLFITCDPARDTPPVLKSYLSEFHPAIVGLTGSWAQIKQVCKAYRVYFSTPEGAQPGMDYLVDHSIYFYLMGTFSSCFYLFLFLGGQGKRQDWIC